MKKNRAKENKLKKKYGLKSWQIAHRSSISGNKRMHRFAGRIAEKFTDVKNFRKEIESETIRSDKKTARK